MAKVELMGGNIWYDPVGIAMARSLGRDSVLLMTRARVIPTQEVTRGGKYSIWDCNIRVLIGSDGIFDVLSNAETNEFLYNIIRGPDGVSALDEGCHTLVEEARRKWQKGLPLDVQIDDTTVVALDFTATIT